MHDYILIRIIEFVLSPVGEIPLMELQYLDALLGSSGIWVRYSSNMCLNLSIAWCWATSASKGNSRISFGSELNNLGPLTRNDSHRNLLRYLGTLHISPLLES